MSQKYPTKHQNYCRGISGGEKWAKSRHFWRSFFRLFGILVVLSGIPLVPEAAPSPGATFLLLCGSSSCTWYPPQPPKRCFSLLFKYFLREGHPTWPDLNVFQMFFAEKLHLTCVHLMYYMVGQPGSRGGRRRLWRGRFWSFCQPIVDITQKRPRWFRDMFQILCARHAPCPQLSNAPSERS